MFSFLQLKMVIRRRIVQRGVLITILNEEDDETLKKKGGNSYMNIRLLCSSCKRIKRMYILEDKSSFRCLLLKHSREI